MPGIVRSSAARAILEKQRDLVAQYTAHQAQVAHVRQRAVDEILPELCRSRNPREGVDEPVGQPSSQGEASSKGEAGPAADEGANEDGNDDVEARVVSYLNDEANIFRFLRRSRFDEDTALKLLATTLRWRLRTDLDMLSVESLHPLYVSPPQHRPALFWMGSRLIDRLGRPCGVISLQSLERTEERTLDECKEYIVACMEIVRRRICQLRRQAHGKRSSAAESDDEAQALSEASGGPLQMVVAFDLQSSSMSNLELELLPFLLDLLKNHFPSMVSAVYVLHYGWVHAGMWGLAKRILPAQALAKIFFPSEKELREEHFETAVLPKPFGGFWDVQIDQASNDCLNKLGRPDPQTVGLRGGSAPSSPTGSPTLGRNRALSRTGSFESVADSYFSASGSPRVLSRSLTPRPSQPPTPRGDGTHGLHGLQMTASAAKKLRKLQMTRGVSPQRHRSKGGEKVSTTASKATGASNPQSATSGLRRVRSLRDFRLDDALTSSSAYPLDQSSDEEREDGSSEKGKQQAAQGKGGEADARATAGTEAATQSGSSSYGVGALRRLLGIGRSTPSQQGDGPPGSAGKVTEDGEAALGAPPSPQLQVQGLPSEVPIADGLVGSATSQATHEGAGPGRDAPRFVSLRRSRKYEGMPGAVSPYNDSNPFWGYPAYIVPSAAASSNNLQELAASQGGPPLRGLHAVQGPAPDQPLRSLGPSGAGGGVIVPTARLAESARSFRVDGSAGRHRHMTVRRRWRDLFRTLSYLFVLRVLALHRQARWRMGRVLRASTMPARYGAKLLSGGRRRARSGVAATTEAGTQEEGGEDVDEGEDEEGERRWREAAERHRKLRAAHLMGRTGSLGQVSATAGVTGKLRAPGATGASTAVLIFLLAWWLASSRSGGGRAVRHGRR
ncbi:unnamed protein product [Parajaminaea phylloscopi]